MSQAGFPVDPVVFRELIGKCFHAGWADWMERKGWVYGEERDPESKTHPHLKEWDDMGLEERESTYVGVDALIVVFQDIGLVTMVLPDQVWPDQVLPDHIG